MAMSAPFGVDPGNQRTFNILTGADVRISMVSLSVILIGNANKKIGRI